MITSAVEAGPRTSAEEGLGRAWRRGTGARGGGRTRKKRAAPVSRKANGRRREEEEGSGVRRGRRGADRSVPGAGGYIPERFTPGASHQPGVCELPTGSKGPFSPVACYQLGVKVYLYSRLVTRTESKGFFWRATKLQPTFTPGWASHLGVKVACSFISRLF